MCEPSCATVDCPSGEVCRSGVCVADPCDGVMCPTDEVCDPTDGMCVADMCDGVTCPAGSSCEAHTGMCVADPCTLVRCPMGQRCEDGECRLEVMPMADAGPPPDGGVRVDAGRMDAGFDDPEDRVLATGGCSCEAAGARHLPRAGWLLLGLLGLLLWRGRRQS